MKTPSLPTNEEQRLEALKSYNLMDSLPEEEFDNITYLASQICETPISLITLVDEDRQWFKSHYGLDATETQRKYAFCAHGLLNPDQPLIVTSASEDERFHDNPLTIGPPHVEFYAGIPLVNSDGFTLGSLCVIDHKARDISPDKIEALKILANQVVKLLELRKIIEHQKKMRSELEQSVKNLEEFAHIVAHDIKAPVRNMKILAQMVQEECEDKLEDDEKIYLEKISESAGDAITYIEGILRYSKAIHFIKIKKNKVDLNQLLDKVVNLVNPPEDIEIRYAKNLPTIRTSEIALQQILTNLISNAVKYNNKKKGWVQVDVELSKKTCLFRISDNGRGIPKDKIDSIFSLFYMVDKKDAKSKGSTGIGLSIVKKIIKNLGGKIQVDSTENEGTTFEFSIHI